MCGRYALTAKEEEIARKFLLQNISPDLKNGLAPRYNIAPSQSVLAVRSTPEKGDREAFFFRWGLVPFWARDIKIGYKLINARSETAAQKPAFRAAMKTRRCLIPASGFYEWRRLSGSNRKQPFYFSSLDDPLLAMAGLWERWKDREGGLLESCCILTTAANEIMSPIHHRMPVLLREKDFSFWLDPSQKNPLAFTPLFEPYPATRMSRSPISTLVNSPKNDGPALIAPADPKTLESP